MARRKKPNADEPQDNSENINNDADETFGLPEVEYEPLKRDETVPEEEVVHNHDPEPVSQTSDETVYHESGSVQEEIEPYQHEENYSHGNDDNQGEFHYQPEEPSIWPKVLGILLFLLIAGGAIYYFAVYQPNQKKARQIELAEEARKKKEAAALLKQQQLDEVNRLAEQRRADSLANIPKTGTLETLTGRTGKYYIVVRSAIDDDLLMDFANKLVKDGKQVKVLPPYGKTKFHRLAIEAKDSYQEAQATADSMKGGEFGDQLWVLRY